MKTLKKFDFQVGGRQESQYDWEKMLDGGIYELEEGKDFTCKSSTFVVMAKIRAGARGQEIKTAKVEGGVVVQATSKPDAKKAAEWKEHQAELRKARKAKNAESNGDAGEDEVPVEE